MREVVLQHPVPTGASNQNGAFGFVRKQGIVFDPAIAECSLLRRGGFPNSALDAPQLFSLRRLSPNPGKQPSSLSSRLSPQTAPDFSSTPLLYSFPKGAW